MVQLLDPIFLSEEEPPPLDISMPQVERRPSPPFSFTRREAPLPGLVAQALKAHQRGDGAGFGLVYGQLVSQFQPALQWALSCWEFILSKEGCRFLPRPPHEKPSFRGDYRVFTERDFSYLVHRIFKESLVHYLEEPSHDLEWTLRQTFWLNLIRAYRTLENPTDTRQRNLTAYSYLRCVPYQFLNRMHHHRVYATVKKLTLPLRQIIELYYLHFYTEEAVEVTTQISHSTFRRRRALGLRTLAAEDYLSFALLAQIERY